MNTPQVFEFSADIDPVALTVNKRFRSNRTIHPDVRRAMDDLVKIVTAKKNREGFELRRDSLLSLTFVFTFRTNRADLDNPLKRTIDSLAEAIGFNDSRVWEIHLYRKTGGTNIYGKIEELRGNEDLWPDEYKPPMQEARWDIWNEERD